jgi:hypothetical protein
VECPHCSTEFAEAWAEIASPSDAEAAYHIQWTTCPACGRGSLKASVSPAGEAENLIGESLLVPQPPGRSVPATVPERFATLFREAERILAPSPRASAALSRRCFRELLVEVAGAPDGNLSAQLEWAISESEIPSRNRVSLHRMRSAGRIGPASPNSLEANAVVDVRPGEAEANLDALESLFEHFFAPEGPTAQVVATGDATTVGSAG